MKYQVIWHTGFDLKPENVLKTKIMTADDISKVNSTSILPPYERKKFEINLKYCVRVILLSPQEHIVDYGSHTRFITIKEFN